MTNGSSVYSLTKHHDKAKKKDLRKKLKSESKMVVESIKEEVESVGPETLQQEPTLTCQQ
jgi:hypothetical protein